MYSCRRWRTEKPGVLQSMGKQSPTRLRDWTTAAMCQAPDTLVRKRKSDKVSALMDYTFQETRQNWNINSSQWIRQLHVVIKCQEGKKEGATMEKHSDREDPSENIASGMRLEGGAGPAMFQPCPRLLLATPVATESFCEQNVPALIVSFCDS